MPKLLVHGATLRCKHGSKCCPLSVDGANHATGASQKVASSSDHVAGTNFSDFGVCALDGNDCVPITPLPWIIESAFLPFTMGPAISSSSTLTCYKAGEPSIEVEDAGQGSIDVQASIEVGLLLQQLEELLEAATGEKLGSMLEALEGVHPLVPGSYWAIQAGLAANDPDCQKEALKHLVKCNQGPPPSSREPPPPRPETVPVLEAPGGAWNDARHVLGSTLGGASAGGLFGLGWGATVGAPAVVAVPGAGVVVEAGAAAVGGVVGLAAGAGAGLVKGVIDIL